MNTTKQIITIPSQNSFGVCTIDAQGKVIFIEYFTKLSEAKSWQKYA